MHSIVNCRHYLRGRRYSVLCKHQLYIQNEYRYQQFLIEYPTHHASFEALRPHLQLELTESVLLQEPIYTSLCSLYAEATEQSGEVSEFICVGWESTAAEKLVSLLRHTAAHIRDKGKKDDPTLIRHIYDLHLILAGKATLMTLGRWYSKSLQLMWNSLVISTLSFEKTPQLNSVTDLNSSNKTPYIKNVIKISLAR